MLRCGGIAPAFLTSELDGGECSTSSPRRLTSGNAASSTHSMGSCVTLRGCLNSMETGEISCPCRESNPRSLVAIPTELYWKRNRGKVLYKYV
jgi:hypothetical protein